MRLVIKIKDGQPFEHPMTEKNFAAAFPNIDLNNLPPEYAWFIRVQPEVGMYEVNEGCTYQWDGNVVKDVWTIRPMTVEEKQAKIDAAVAWWESQPDRPLSWVFDEPTCAFVPPIPKPDDGKYYVWDEATIAWVEK